MTKKIAILALFAILSVEKANAFECTPVPVVNYETNSLLKVTQYIEEMKSSYESKAKNELADLADALEKYLQTIFKGILIERQWTVAMMAVAAEKAKEIQKREKEYIQMCKEVAFEEQLLKEKIENIRAKIAYLQNMENEEISRILETETKNER